VHQLVKKQNFGKGKNIYLNTCLLPKLPSKEHLPKFVCLATPGISHGSAILFVSKNVFTIKWVLLTGKKYLMGSIREVN
jgi:hypothetical protein